MSLKRSNLLPARSVPSSPQITSCGLLKLIKRVLMLLMINVISYRMALAPFRMATSERYEHCIVHTVFEHYIVLFSLLVWHDAYFVWILSLYLNIDVVFYVWILIVHDNKRLKYISFFYYTHVKKSKTSNQQIWVGKNVPRQQKVTHCQQKKLTPQNWATMSGP